MNILLIVIQLISIYRACAVFIFILFYTFIPTQVNTLLLLTAIGSDLLDGYLARKFNLTTKGGKMLDLFSDKYLTCVSIIFLIINQYPLTPCLVILTKEIFVLSFRSIEIDGQYVISTNRLIGGIMSGALWLSVIVHINNIQCPISGILYILGLLNLCYLIYKIISNWSSLKKVFKS